MRRRLFLILILLAAVLSTGLGAREEGAGFKNRSAAAAEADYDRVVGKAREQFDRTTAKAREIYLARLKRAQEEATRAADLDDAVRIRAAIDRLAEHGKKPVGKEDSPLLASPRALEARLTANAWSYDADNVPDRNTTIRFNPDGTANIGANVAQWLAVDGREALVRYDPGGGFDKLVFNEDVTAYDAYFQANGFANRWGGGRVIQKN